MISKRVFLLTAIIVLSVLAPETVFAQSGAQGVGVSLEVEIQNIERTITRQGIPPAERHEALVRLARLRQLSGDIEGAAKNWLEAATAIPGRIDDDALLSCAFCLAAMGEWDRAATAVEPLVTKMPRARFLDLSIKAIKSGDTTFLAAIVDHPNYYELKPEIIFVLWKVSGSSGERWRQRLVAEFPQTPEGRLASGQSPSSIIVRPSPFWLFASGLDSLPLTGSVTAGRPTQTAAASPTTGAAQAAPAPQPQPTVQPQPVQPQPSTSTTARLQTGIFSRQANAQAQVTKLKNAGFSPSIERRIVNNSEMWAVTVPAGANQTQTVNALRAAGFESFLVR